MSVVVLAVLYLDHWLSLSGSRVVSPLVAVALGLGFCLLNFALSSPDRKVPADYFLRERRFLLTGCASGMGRHLARALLERGHKVCATDVDEKGLLAAYDDYTQKRCANLLVQRLDVRDPEAWVKVVSLCEETWGGVDVAMNIAGVLAPHRVQDATTSEINLQIDVNVKGVVFGTKAVSALMAKQQEGGQIINFSSMAAIGVVSGVTIYHASKFAVRGFSLAAAKDLADLGVCVTCFLPDAVQTPMVDLQLNFDEGAMAFSGDILSLAEMEDCIINHAITERPVEIWLSSRARLARFGDILGASRVVLLAEACMKHKGRKRQSAILGRDSSSSFKAKTSSMVGSGKAFFCALAVLAVAWTYAFMNPAPHVTAQEIAQRYAPNIVGKTYIVTGASGGIGEETARVLVQQGAKVIVVSPDSARGLAAVDRINFQTNKHNLGAAEFMALDLGSFGSIDSFVSSFVSQSRPLHGLVCNAGLFSPKYGRTKDGLERVLQVNHLGHQYLTTELLATLEASAPSRVVVVSSYWSALYARPDFVEYAADTYPFLGFQAYGTSKLANLRFSRELGRLSKGKGVTTYAVHPGVIGTGLGAMRGDSWAALLDQYGSGVFWAVLSPWTKNIPQGAATQVYCLVAEGLEVESSLYYHDAKQAPFPFPDGELSNGRDQDVWQQSQQLIAEARAGKRPGGVWRDEKAGWFPRLDGLWAMWATASVHVVAYMAVFAFTRLLDDHGCGLQEVLSVLSSAVVDALYCFVITRSSILLHAGTETSWVHTFVALVILLVWEELHLYFTYRARQWDPLFSHQRSPWKLHCHVLEAVMYFSGYLVVFLLPTPLWLWFAYKAAVLLGPLSLHLGYNLFDLSTSRRLSLRRRLSFASSTGNTAWRFLRGLVCAFLLYRTAMVYLVTYGFASKASGAYAVFGGACVLYALLVDGVLLIKPTSPLQKRKVFVIGLSRTGTTSISCALNHLGWRTHHMCGQLADLKAQGGPSLKRAYSDCFDGHTDLAPAVVFEQLAHTYPDALFIYTTRPVGKWAAAMVDFMQKEPRKCLFKSHPVADGYYRAVYGADWAHMSEEEFVLAYNRHDERVSTFFSASTARSERFMELDITTMASQNHGKDLWEKLCTFIGASEIPAIPFPHRYVFRYSFVDQPCQQLAELVIRLGAWWMLFGVLVASVVLAGAQWLDYGQCARACGAYAKDSVNGTANLAFSADGYPPNPTIFSAWDSCVCPENQRLVPRYYISDPFLEPYTTSRVCGADAHTYADHHEAALNGVRVVSCSFCGRCSNDADINVYHTLGTRMTAVATKCAIVNLLAGSVPVLLCAEHYMGLTPDCATCWQQNMECTTAHCFHECILGHGNPLTASNNINGTALSSCLECDELRCSHAFLRCAGANRRLAGVVTDIGRTKGEVCQRATRASH